MEDMIANSVDVSAIQSEDVDRDPSAFGLVKCPPSSLGRARIHRQPDHVIERIFTCGIDQQRLLEPEREAWMMVVEDPVRDLHLG